MLFKLSLSFALIFHFFNLLIGVVFNSIQASWKSGSLLLSNFLLK